MGGRGEWGKDINWFLEFEVCQMKGTEDSHVNFFSVRFQCKDFIQMHVFGIRWVIFDYLLGFKSILPLDLPLNPLMFPLFPLLFFFFPSLGQGVLFSSLSLQRPLWLSEKSQCTSQFFTDSPLRLFGKKRQGGEFWLIINKHKALPLWKEKNGNKWWWFLLSQEARPTCKGWLITGSWCN